MAKSKVLFETLQNITTLDKKLQSIEKALNNLVKPSKSVEQNTKKIKESFKDSKNKISQTAKEMNKFKNSGQSAASVLKKEFKDFWGEFQKNAGLSFGRIAKFTLLYKIFRGFIDISQEAVKELIVFNDKLVDLKRIAELSNSQVDALGKNIISLSYEYGIASLDAAKLTEIWVQQGKTGQELATLMDVTAKATVALGVSAKSASESITVLTNVFGIGAENIEFYIDKLKNVESKNAILAQDLVDAYKKVGSASKAAGVDIDTLNGLIGNLSSTLRVTGTYAGNFLKILFARLRRPELAKYLEEIGILNDRNRESFQDTEQLLSLLASRWDSLNSAQQFAIAELTGGLRRFQDFVTLMQNYDKTIKIAGDSVNSFGAANAAAETNLEKITSSTNKLKTSLQDLTVSLGGLTIFKGLTFITNSLSKATSGLSDSIESVSKIAERDIEIQKARRKEMVAGISAIAGLGTSILGLSAALTSSGIGAVPGILIGISAGLVSLFSFGKLSESLDVTSLKKDFEELSKIVSNEGSLRKSIRNLTDNIAFKLRNEFDKMGERLDIGEIISTSLESSIPDLETKLTREQLDNLQKSLAEIKKETSITKRETLISELSRQLEEYLKIYEKVSKEVKDNRIFRRLQKDFSGSHPIKTTVLNDLKTQMEDYKKTGVEALSAVKEEYEAQQLLIRNYGHNAIVTGLDPTEVTKNLRIMKDRLGYLTFFEDGDDKAINAALDALFGLANGVKQTNEQIKKNTISEEVSLQMDKISQAADQAINTYVKYIGQAKKERDGANYEFLKDIQSILVDNSFIDRMAEVYFNEIFKGGGEDLNKLREELRKSLETLAGSKSAKAEIKFEENAYRNLLSLETDRVAKIEQAAQAELELLKTKLKSGQSSEQEISKQKAILKTQKDIQSLQEKLQGEDFQAGEKETLQGKLALLEAQLKSLENQDSKLNQIIKSVIDYKNALSDTNEVIKEGISLDRRLENLIRTKEAENAVLQSKIDTKEITREQYEISSKISDLEKERLSISDKLKNAEESKSDSAEVYRKQLIEIDSQIQKANKDSEYYATLLKKHAELTKKVKDATKEVGDEWNKNLLRIEGQFADAFLSLPEKFNEASEQNKQINQELNAALEDYNNAVSRFNESKNLYNQTGSDKYLEAMNTAKNDVESMRDSYSQIADEAKRINEETDKFKILVTEISDILQEKLLESIADSLIESSGLIDSLSKSTASLFNKKPNVKVENTEAEKKDKTEEAINNMADNQVDAVAEGTEKAGFKLIPFLSKTLLASGMFSSSGGKIGSAIGSLGGELGWFGKGITAGVGSLLGGLIGDAFSGGEIRTPTFDMGIGMELPQAFERNTRELRDNTNAIKEMSSSIIAAPNSFALPKLGALQTQNQITINISGVIGNEDEVSKKITDTVNDALRSGALMN